MNRRNFIKQSGALGALALTPLPCLSVLDKFKYKMGYQLYSIRDEMAKDPIRTLKALKTMGYQDFEVYGFDDEKGTYYGFKSTEFKRILDDLGLSATSGHYGFSSYLEKSEDEMKRFVDHCIVGAKALNS
ncbi:MAG: twin-arginine translocation signal domain-containing protein, partial [Flavobacteriaceae bacterium]